MSRFIIMSDEIPDINESVSKEFEIIKTDCIKELLPFERRHADMQCLRINDVFFVLKEAKNLSAKLESLGLNVVRISGDISAEYPKNVLLNAVFLHNRLYCRAKSLANEVRKYCENHGIELINVNQGYTKCSAAVLEDCFITADRGIYKAMSENREEGLLIESGDIGLTGVDYGFIGGCTFTDSKKVYFSGDITKHGSYSGIKEFCDKKGLTIVSLSKNKLYDTGGFIVI